MNANKDMTPNQSNDLLPEGIHLCYIYSDDEERERTMANFFADGLIQGLKALSIVDTVHPHDVAKRLKDMGVLLSADKPQLSTAPNDASYCPDGMFKPDSLLAGVGAFCEQAHVEGFKGARISGDMAWAIRQNVSMTELLEYEVKVTEYLKTCPFTAICEYDARKFDGATIMDILSVHPSIIVRGHVVKNPYYIEPQAFLEHLKARISPNA